MANHAAQEKPLGKMAEAFKDLANTLNSQTLDEDAQMEVAPFSHGCTLVSPLFRCLGIAFKFAELDYVAKVDDLAEASKSITTLHKMMDQDIQANCVRTAGSHTRNLLRVKRGLDMVKVLFEQILATEVPEGDGSSSMGLLCTWKIGCLTNLLAWWCNGSGSMKVFEDHSGNSRSEELINT